MVERSLTDHGNIVALKLGLKSPCHLTCTTIMDTFPGMPSFVVFYKIRPTHDIFWQINNSWRKESMANLYFFLPRTLPYSKYADLFVESTNELKFWFYVPSDNDFLLLNFFIKSIFLHTSILSLGDCLSEFSCFHALCYFSSPRFSEGGQAQH